MSKGRAGFATEFTTNAIPIIRKVPIKKAFRFPIRYIRMKLCQSIIIYSIVSKK